MGARHHLQIRPPPRGIEERLARVPPNPAALGHREIARSLVVAVVEILGGVDPDLGRRLRHVVEDGPVQPLPFHPQLAADTVHRILRAEMIFGPPEIRQDILPPPAGIAHLPPLVIVPRLPAHVDHAVDRRTPAQKLAARIIQRPAAQPLLRLGPIAPVHRRIAHGMKITDRHMNPEPVVAAPGLEKQDTGLRIGAETVRQHATGRTRPHNDIVVLAGLRRVRHPVRTHCCSCTPSPSISSRMVCPSCSQTCGRIPRPTPGGVPVVTTSPGSSVMK